MANHGREPSVGVRGMTAQRSYDLVATVWDRLIAPLILAPPARDLLAALDLESAASVLDVGAGGGVAALAVSEALGANGAVVALDPAAQMLRQLQKKDKVQRLVAGQAPGLPFRDGAFNAIVGNFVLLGRLCLQTSQPF